MSKLDVSLRGIGEPTTCNECKRETRILEARDQGLWVKCLSCGFEEWEWQFSDDPAYLEYLAKRHKTTVKAIWQALKTEVPTQVQETIVRQLLALNPNFILAYWVKAILWKEDGRSVRLHTKKGGRTVNIDIIYHRIPDVYQIKAYEVNALKAECHEIKDVKDVLVDMLHPVISDIIEPIYYPKF